MEWWEKYKVDIPEGTEGAWSVSRFEVSEEDAAFQNARAAFSFTHRGLAIRPGVYTRLMHGGVTVMSDVPSEIYDHMEPIREARGRVLIAGLGLGMVTAACLEKPDVEHVTVVELASEVIHLVGDHLKGIYGDRLDITQGDVYEWKPPKGVRWDVAWFDVWNDICLDNLPKMSTLHRRFGRRADWKGSWSRERLLYERDRERRGRW